MNRKDTIREALKSLLYEEDYDVLADGVEAALVEWEDSHDAVQVSRTTLELAVRQGPCAAARDVSGGTYRHKLVRCPFCDIAAVLRGESG